MRNSLLIVLAVAAGCLSGCAKARIVEVTPQGGVVAIPSNSNSWPNYYRDQAEELMRERCPDGFEIVEEKEVVTGQVAHTQSNTQRKKSPSLDLGRVAQDDKDPDNHAASLAGLKIPLGPTHTRTETTTNYKDVTEYRIYYRPKAL